MMVYGAQCDSCGKVTLKYGTSTKTYLVRMLRAEGWSVGNPQTKHAPERTLCPNCRKRPKKANEKN